MIVYAACYVEYDSVIIFGVFSTEEKAKECLRKRFPADYEELEYNYPVFKFKIDSNEYAVDVLE